MSRNSSYGAGRPRRVHWCGAWERGRRTDRRTSGIAGFLPANFIRREDQSLDVVIHRLVFRPDRQGKMGIVGLLRLPIRPLVDHQVAATSHHGQFELLNRFLNADKVLWTFGTGQVDAESRQAIGDSFRDALQVVVCRKVVIGLRHRPPEFTSSGRKFQRWKTELRQRMLPAKLRRAPLGDKTNGDLCYRSGHLLKTTTRRGPWAATRVTTGPAPLSGYRFPHCDRDVAGRSAAACCSAACNSRAGC